MTAADVDDGFVEALAGLQAVGASPDTEALVAEVVRHGSEEGDLLATYAAFAETASSPAVRYLVNLILSDERRHHQVLVEMASAIAWGEFPGTPSGATPVLDVGPADEEVVEVARQLLDRERQDHRALLHLRRRLRPYADTTMWALLVDLMIADTEKHQRILGFTLDHLKRRR